MKREKKGLGGELSRLKKNKETVFKAMCPLDQCTEHSH